MSRRINVMIDDDTWDFLGRVPAGDESDAGRALLLREALLQERVQALVKFGLREAPISGRWLAMTLGITQRCGSTFYDAAYHATALVHGGVFITADAQYAARAQREGGIVLLADWVPPR